MYNIGTRRVTLPSLRDDHPVLYIWVDFLLHVWESLGSTLGEVVAVERGYCCILYPDRVCTFVLHWKVFVALCCRFRSYSTYNDKSIGSQI